MGHATAEPAPRPADFLVGLSAQQREAVLYPGGVLAVLAGPGAGKTRVIVHRVARLLAPADSGGAGAEPESILAVTFTNNSAEQLRERLADLVGPSASMRVQACTHHSFGRRLVNRFGDMIGIPATQRIMDSAERRRMLRDLITEHDLFPDRRAAGRDALVDSALEFISLCAHDAITPQRAKEWCADRERRLATNADALDDVALAGEAAALAHDTDRSRLFDLFERHRLSRGMLTLDDYITLPIRILRDAPRAAAIIRSEIRHIVVDEFQDWSPAQIELLRLLWGGDRVDPAHTARSLCVVGDDDQAIYSFRGADDRAFSRFSEAWEGHAVINLATNYRSAPPIIAAANAIIARASARYAAEKHSEPDPRRAATRPPHAPDSIEGAEVDDDRDAGLTVAAMIRADRQSSRDAGAERSWKSYAVLARTNAEVDRIVAMLAMEEIPCFAGVRESPLDDLGVQDLLAWIRLLANPADSHHAQRLLVRPPLGVPVQRVSEWATQHRSARNQGDASNFLEWLAEISPEDQAVKGLLGLHADLRAFSATARADVSLDEIVRRTDVIHADALAGADRAKRVRNVLTALRSARELAPRLDPPGDLAAFLRHYDDLDEGEQNFKLRGDDAVDAKSSDVDEAKDAVRVLTAHTAKGLEFDTVFVVRIRPPHGFPLTSAPARTVLPKDLTGRDAPDPIDEERRLFYVACTRAERRLILIAKRKKDANKTTSTDFFIELTRQTPGLTVPVADAQDWMKRAGMRTPDEQDRDAADSGNARAWLDVEISRAKRDAAAGLHHADRGDVSAQEVAALADALRSSAERIAALAHLRDHGVLPPFVSASDPRHQTLHALAARVAAGRGPEALVCPMKAPLSLSYSKLSEYMHGCPRCFYTKYVLKYDEPKSSRLQIGDIAHKSLEAFYRQWRDADAEAESEGSIPGLDRLLALGEQIFRAEWPRSEVFDAAALAQLRAQLQLCWTNLHDPAAHIQELERTINFHYKAAGVAHDFNAKIDRIDELTGARHGVRIIDYKTGHATKKLLEPKPDDLQLSIYAMALASFQGRNADSEPLQGDAEYWLLSTGQRGVIDLADLKIDKVKKQIDEAIRGMLAGEFPRNVERCKGLCAVIGEE